LAGLAPPSLKVLQKKKKNLKKKIKILSLFFFSNFGPPNFSSSFFIFLFSIWPPQVADVGSVLVVKDCDLTIVEVYHLVKVEDYHLTVVEVIGACYIVNNHYKKFAH
jgi:hypothetical protein